ncbi:MAG: formate dehydrogenase accessory sulfurtransferase FdhD [Anaeromyxobacter sp.]
MSDERLPSPRARLAEVDVLRRGRAAPGRAPGAARDLVAVEEPLEIRVGGETVGVLMRTPGDDEKLALGFLFAEGIITSADDVAAVYHCGRPDDEGFGNLIEVAPSSSPKLDLSRLDGARRPFAASSACGVCGRQAVADLLCDLPRPEPGFTVLASELSARIDRLRDNQPVFERTGGAHVAALWGRDGALLAAHEDVGRHNAVDKVVGALLVAQVEARRAGEPVPGPGMLTVSSRAGVEIVQKAAKARIPVVATVSAPTSLAVELATQSGLTLAAFVRGTGMNVYAGKERIVDG